MPSRKKAKCEVRIYNLTVRYANEGLSPAAHRDLYRILNTVAHDEPAAIPGRVRPDIDSGSKEEGNDPRAD